MDLVDIIADAFIEAIREATVAIIEDLETKLIPDDVPHAMTTASLQAMNDISGLLGRMVTTQDNPRRHELYRDNVRVMAIAGFKHQLKFIDAAVTERKTAAGSE